MDRKQHSEDYCAFFLCVFLIFVKSIVKVPNFLKPNGRVGNIATFLTSSRGIFDSFYKAILRQKNAPPLEIPYIFVRSFGNFKAKKQDPWKFILIFHPSSTPPALCLVFFWNNSPILFLSKSQV